MNQFRPLYLMAVLMATVNGVAAVLTVSHAGDDDSPAANGYKTIAAAVAAAREGDSVEIEPYASPYVLDAEVAINKAITVRGGGADRTAVVIESDGEVHRMFNISDKDAVLSGVTIQNVNSPSDNGGTIYLSAGTVTNCVLTRIYAKNGSSYGNGIWMANTADALVTHCRFDDVSSRDGERTGSMTGGCAIYCDGKNALVRQCEIVNCFANGNHVAWGGIVQGTTISDSIIRACSSNDRFYGIVKDATVYRCEISGCSPSAGPVVYGCTVFDCLIADNEAAGKGNGGTYNIIDNSSVLHNCTVVGNTIGNNMFCVGPSTKVYNSIVWGNTNSVGEVMSYDSSLITKAEFECSCVSPLPISGAGNTDDDPCLTGDYHLGAGSSAFNSGLDSLRTDLTDESKDLAGAKRVLLGTIDRGCYEKTTLDPGQFTVSVSDVATVSCLTGIEQTPAALLVACAGDRFDIEWMWGDGTSTRVENHTAVGGEETISARHAYGIGGIMDLTVKVTNRATQEERQVTVVEKYAVKNTTPNTYYVSSVIGDNNNDGLSAAAPFATIKSALTAACDGSVIRIMAGGDHLCGEQLEVTAAVVVEGWRATGDGPAAKEEVVLRSDGRTHRILHLNNSGAIVRGLTVTGARFNANGCGVYLDAGTVTDCFIHDNAKNDGSVSGVGVYLANTADAILSDCVVSNNFSAVTWISGAGAYSPGRNAKIRNCVFVDNSPNGNGNGWGGVVCGATLSDCVIRDNANSGGSRTRNGVRSATLYRCQIVGNTGGNGTVLADCEVYDSLVAENVSGRTLIDSNTKLHGCTVTGNTVDGTESCLAANTKVDGSIVWGNMNTDGPANYAAGATFTDSCVSPAAEGTGNISDNPQLDMREKRKYQLTARSPCLNRIAFEPPEERTNDLAGNPRVKKLMDMGCYEFTGTAPTVILVR